MPNGANTSACLQVNADQVLETLYQDPTARVHHRRNTYFQSHDGELWVWGWSGEGYRHLAALTWDQPDLVDRLQSLLDQN